VTGDTAIVCAGTLSQITCYCVRSLDLDGYGEPAAAYTMPGNDAVVAARLLRAAGTPAACLLLGPTDSDVAALLAAEPSLPVLTAGLRPGSLTTSAVLQAADGHRYWLLPPRHPGDIPLPEPESATGALVYADMYDELEDAVTGWLATVRPSGLIINLSDSRHTEKAARLAPLRPLLVQAAVPHATSGRAIARTARELRKLACAQYVLVSAGPRGFTLAGPAGQTWTRMPPRPAREPVLGAGAALSAGILHALAHRSDGGLVADIASDWAAAYLKGVRT
jgi:hypothetical protein